MICEYEDSIFRTVRVRLCHLRVCIQKLCDCLVDIREFKFYRLSIQCVKTSTVVIIIIIIIIIIYTTHLESKSARTCYRSIGEKNIFNKFVGKNELHVS